MILFLILFLSPHPYLFFNEDGMTITFVGFTVTRHGDLINPMNRRVLEKRIMTRQLYNGLVVNKVNFEDNYRNWKKETMVHKIATVIGVKSPKDPDSSYVLTVDNVIKILAIQMRFRSAYICLIKCMHFDTLLSGIPNFVLVTNYQYLLGMKAKSLAIAVP